MKKSVLGSAIFLLAACGSDGSQGPQGPQGASGDSDAGGSTSLVSPAQGLLDRELDVEIGGSGTKWTDADKPDFGGMGVTVTDSHAASPTLLVAHVQIAKDAPLGKRDVKVGAVTATQAFTVAPGIDVKDSATMGAVSVDQGGLAQFDINNNDTKAFDTNSFKLTAAGIVDLGTSASSPQAATGFVLAAPLAAAGKGQVVVSNLGSDGNPKLSWYSDPTALEVKARAASSLTLGTAATETFTGDGTTKLFKTASASGVSILDFRMEVTDPKATTLPYIIVFNASAKSGDDQIALAGPPASLFGPAPPPYDIHATHPVLSGGADIYAVMLDLSKSVGSAVKFTPSSIAATKVAESATAHGTGAPQAIGTLPATDGFVVDGNLAMGDVDAYQVAAVAGDKIQIAASSAADLDILIVKTATVSDPNDPAWLDEIFSGAKASASSTVTLAGQTNLFVVVKADSQGKVPTGAYALSARKVP
ncbi:MAG TPA: hypothetical protein VIF62_02480 [Labilithrix sp.]